MYPTGASEQFFDMYLDEDVKAAFERYDVLGIIEHDVKIAHEDSFSQLYKSAFHGSQGYWVKGSVLGEAGLLYNVPSSSLDSNQEQSIGSKCVGLRKKDVSIGNYVSSGLQ